MAGGAIGLLVALGSCGKDAPASTPKTELTITVVADEGATAKVMTLTCDPAGGSQPQPTEACAVLDKAGAKVFEPVPNDQPCTMLYGGPQTATVKGIDQGAKVDAKFSRTNGCETSRWEKLGTTFFNVPLQ